MSQQEKSRDPLINFKNTKKVVTKTGKEGLQLSMNTQQATELVTALQANLGNERGVKIAVYYSDKATEDGRTFLSGFAIVSAIQEFGANRTTASTKKVFGPRPTSAVEDKIKKSLAD